MNFACVSCCRMIIRSQPGTRYLQLDGLRALVVILMVYTHYFNYLFPPESPVHYLGTACVRFFFVLSGYFITHSLLRLQRKLGHRGASLREYYKRRFVRILPPYYAIILLGAATGMLGVAQLWPWYLSFANNWHVFITGSWGHVGMGHMWTLAVQEQFYLIWPTLLYFVPVKYRYHLLAGFILSGLLFRWGLWLGGWAQLTIPVSATFSNFEDLGLGALLAYLHFNGRDLALWLRRVLLLAGSALALYGIYLANLKGQFLYFHSGATWLCLLLVAYFIRKPSSGAWLRQPVLVYLGSISYGIYLYHLPLLQYYSGLNNVCKRYGLNWPGSSIPLAWQDHGQPVAMGAIYFMLTILCAMASHHWLEKPIKRWLLPDK